MRWFSCGGVEWWEVKNSILAVISPASDVAPCVCFPSQTQITFVFLRVILRISLLSCAILFPADVFLSRKSVSINFLFAGFNPNWWKFNLSLGFSHKADDILFCEDLNTMTDVLFSIYIKPQSSWLCQRSRSHILFDLFSSNSSNNAINIFIFFYYYIFPIWSWRNRKGIVFDEDVDDNDDDSEHSGLLLRVTVTSTDCQTK